VGWGVLGLGFRWGEGGEGDPPKPPEIKFLVDKTEFERRGLEQPRGFFARRYENHREENEGFTVALRRN